MKNHLTNEELVLLVQKHNRIGWVLAPYIVRPVDSSINLVEVVSDKTLSSEAYGFDTDEVQMLRKLISTSDVNLYKAYSRSSSVQTFWNGVDANTFELISNFLDKQFGVALDIAMRIGTPIYLRNIEYSTIYEADRLTICSDKVRPTFYFFLSKEQELAYTLKIFDGQEETSLYKRKVLEITKNPSTIVVGKKLYRFRNIDCAKFRPFKEKSRIRVPASVVPKYMETYVRQCIMNYYVRASGFRVLKRNVDCKPILKLEDNVFGKSLRLFFAYGENTYQYGENRRTVDLTYEDDTYVFYTCHRQLDYEQQIAELLIDQGLTHTGNNNFMPEKTGYTSKFEVFANWLNDHADMLSNAGISSYLPENYNYYIGHTELKTDVSEKNDWFDVEAIVVFDDFQIPFAKFLPYLREGKREYKLPNGKHFVMPEEWFASWADIAAFATIKKGVIQINKLHAQLMPDILLQDTACQELADMKPATPLRRGNICATLRPYQDEGFRWLKTLYENNRGGILADDMGLGKTLQVIALLAHIYATDNQSIPASLIVMPTSLIHNWNNELRRFAPQLKTAIYSNHSRPRNEQLAQMIAENNVVLSSYGIVRNDAEQLSPLRFHYIVLDESQYIKNSTSKIYQAITSLTADHHLTLTGTPIENRLSDMWSQMNFANPGLLGSLNFFRSYFERIIQHGNNPSRSQRLRDITTPYILRRTKEMVATDLPPITQQDVLCPMTAEQYEVYESEKSAFRNQILGIEPKAQTLGRDKLMVLQSLMRLRLIANHPQLVDPTYEASSGKLDMVLEYIENICAERHKMLVFSSFVRDLELLGRCLAQRGIGYSILTGTTSHREEVIQDFQTSEQKNVFLISIKTGGVGLNLTCADYVFVLNPWWNPAVEEQAINRAHRIGQTKNVFVYRFLTKDSIEEKISLLQERKRTLAKDFVASTNIINDLSLDDLSQLA